MKIKQLFFDKETVLRSVDTATRKVFGRFGAFVRNAARWSMRKKPPMVAMGDQWVRFGGDWKPMSPSAPGSPPYSRGGALRKYLFFALEPSRKTVVIGPTLTKSSGVSVPEVLEYGGVSEVFDFAIRKRRKIRIAPRPYMGPAFDKGKTKLPDLWQNVTK